MANDTHAGRPRIFAIDDDAATRALLVEALSGAYDVRVFERASDARDALAQESAQLVLLDVKLPDADGLELLCELRGRWPDIPIVMLTGSVGIESVVRAVRAGAVDYVPKPVDLLHLEQTIARALRAAAAAPARAQGSAECGPTFVLPPEGVDLAALEQSLVRQALERTHGNRTRAGRLLGINRDQVRYRLAKLDPPPPGPRSPSEEAAAVALEQQSAEGDDGRGRRIRA